MTKPPARLAAIASILVIAAVACGFGNDLVFAAGGLDVTPNPAQRGDAVTLVFQLTVVPARHITMRVLIDDAVHATTERDTEFSGAFEIPLGDAGDLIDAYGTGVHTVRIEVREHEDGKTVGTSTREFELQ